MSSSAGGSGSLEDDVFVDDPFAAAVEAYRASGMFEGAERGYREGDVSALVDSLTDRVWRGVWDESSRVMNGYPEDTWEVYQDTACLPTIEFDCAFNKGILSIELTEQSLEGMSADSRSMTELLSKNKLMFHGRDVEKVPHELVEQMFGKSDRKIRDILGIEGMHGVRELDWTPDFGGEMPGGGCHAFLELTTDRGNCNGRSVLARKVRKYARAVEKIQAAILEAEQTGQRIPTVFPTVFIYVIVVKRDRIVTNFPLSEMVGSVLAAVMCAWARTGWNLREEAKSLGWTPHSTREEQLEDIASECLQAAGAGAFEAAPTQEEAASTLLITKELIQKAQDWDSEDAAGAEERLIKHYRDLFKRETDKLMVNLRDVPALHERERAFYQKKSDKWRKDCIETARSSEAEVSVKCVVPAPLIVPGPGSEGGETWPHGICVNSYNLPTSVLELWNHGFCQYNSRRVPRTTATPEEVAALEKKEGTVPSADQKLLDRGRAAKVTVLLTSEAKMELAKRGVNSATGYAMNEKEMEEHNRDSKRPVHPNSSVADIESYVMRHYQEIMGQPLDGVPRYIERAEELMKQSQEAHAGIKPEELGALYQHFSRTKGFLYYESISEAAQEMLYGLKSYSTKGTEWRMKRLPNYNMWMIYKATPHLKQLHVSFFYPTGPGTFNYTDIVSAVHRKVYRAQQGLFTEVISLSESKLKNWATASANYLSSAARFFELDGCKFDEHGRPLVSEDAWSNVGITMAVHMEDKSCTEEVISPLRYTMTDKMVVPFVEVDAAKMIKKMPVLFRSRMQLWAAKKHVLYMSPRGWSRAVVSPEGDEVDSKEIAMAKALAITMKRRQAVIASMARGMREQGRESEAEEQDKLAAAIEKRLKALTTGLLMTDVLPGFESKDVGFSQQVVWTGIKNPFTGRTVRDHRVVLDLSFIGYAKNKDEAAKSNKDLDLIKKTVMEEISFWRTDPTKHMYEGEFLPAEELKDHAVSLDFIRGVSSMARKKLKRESGGTWEATLYESIIKEVSSVTWLELATLKASSTFDGTIKKSSKPRKTAKGGNQAQFPYARTKTVLAVNEVLRKLDVTSPAEALPAVMSVLEGDGRILVDMFRKLQHGGIREIYVTEIHARICQKIMESISRVICRTYSSETLTNPDRKHKIPVEHAVNCHSFEKEGNSICNANSSNDATTWSQTMDPQILCTFVLGVAPRKAHGFITKVMRLWEQKKIRPPTGVLQLAEKYVNNQSDLSIDDDAHMMIMNTIWGNNRQEDEWYDRGSQCLSLSSGFMQGILHYTSSLYHAACLDARDKCFKKWVESARKKMDLNFFMVSHDMVSSDDTARLVSVVMGQSMSPAEKATLLACMCADQLLATDFFRQGGIRMSPKSTMCSAAMVEFNSTFYFGPSVFMPRIKFTLSAANIVETESLFARQESFYNLLSQVPACGLSFEVANTVQTAQALLHYRMLGISTSKYGEAYAERLKALPSPMLGFFLMDDPRCPGLLGLRYSHWAHVKAFPALSSSYACSLRTESMTTTEHGNLTQPYSIKFADKTKWEELMDSLSQGLEDWPDRIARNPRLLYKDPETVEEIRLQMIVKMSSPGVGSSLGQNTGIARMMSAGAYMLETNCVAVAPNWWDRCGVYTDPVRKFCLMAHLTKAIEKTSGVDPLTPEEVKHVFPSSLDFQKVMDNLTSIPTYEDIVFTRSNEDKMIKINVPIYGADIHKTVTLMKLVCWKWFGDTTDVAVSLLEKYWAEACSVLPWLADTHDESLQASPFRTCMELKNYIARDPRLERSFFLVGATGHHTSLEIPYVSLIRRHLRKGYLVGKDVCAYANMDREVAIMKRDQMQLRLANLLSAPIKGDYKNELAIKILSDMEAETKDRAALSGFHSHSDRALEVMRKVAQCKRWGGQPGNVLEMISNLKKGQVGHFRKVVAQRVYGLKKKSRATTVFTYPEWPATGYSTRVDKETGKRVYTLDGHDLVEWFGFIGRVTVKARFTDKQLVSVTTSSVSGLMEEAGSFESLLRDFSVKSTGEGHLDTYRKVPKAIHTRSGIILRHTDMPGIPILQDDITYYLGEEVELSYFDFEVRADRIRLRMSSMIRWSDEAEETSLNLTVLTYKPRRLLKSNKNEFVDNDDELSSEPEVIRNWLDGKPLDAGLAHELAKRVANHFDHTKRYRSMANDSVWDLFDPALMRDTLHKERDRMMKKYGKMPHSGARASVSGTMVADAASGGQAPETTQEEDEDVQNLMNRVFDAFVTAMDEGEDAMLAEITNSTRRAAEMEEASEQVLEQEMRECVNTMKAASGLAYSMCEVMEELGDWHYDTFSLLNTAVTAGVPFLPPCRMFKAMMEKAEENLGEKLLSSLVNYPEKPVHLSNAQENLLGVLSLEFVPDDGEFLF